MKNFYWIFLLCKFQTAEACNEPNPRKGTETKKLLLFPETVAVAFEEAGKEAVAF